MVGISSRSESSAIHLEKNIWPWAVDYQSVAETMLGGSTWPKISIVTPSFNQAAYLEETIRSVLLQGYPNLEYIIIDGGSTDGSVEIIKKYEPWLAYWVSEPDRGQYHAINKGFERSSGEIMAWINSDDKYFPWTFRVVAEIFSTLQQVDWLTTNNTVLWKDDGNLQDVVSLPGYARSWAYRGWHLGNQPGFKGWVQQESTFWRRELWQKAGGCLDEGLKFAGDFELWLRFWRYSDLTTVSIPLGGFRIHKKQKTGYINAYYEEAEAVLKDYRKLVVTSRFIIRSKELILKFMKRGGKKWGSKMPRVWFDWGQNKWAYGFNYVI